MKIVTWNINGIRTFRGGIKQILDSLGADIICVQETKVTSKLALIIVAHAAIYQSVMEVAIKQLAKTALSQQETCWMRELQLLTGTTPTSATAEDAAAIQVHGIVIINLCP